MRPCVPNGDRRISRHPSRAGGKRGAVIWRAWLMVLIELDEPIVGNPEAWGGTFAEAVNAALDAAERSRDG